MNNKTNIQLVIFDAYGVCLTGGYPDTSQALAKKFKRNWQDIYAVLYTKYFNQAATKVVTQQEAWSHTIKDLNLPTTVNATKKLHYDLMGFNANVLKIVGETHKKTQVVLLSKNTRSQLADINRKFPILRKVFGRHNIINTWEYDLPKASKETMLMVLKRYGVRDASKVIYIDDQDTNLVAARQLGVKTILYKNFEQFKKEFYESF